MDYSPESRTPPRTTSTVMPPRRPGPSRPIAAAFFHRGSDGHQPTAMRPTSFLSPGPNGYAHGVQFISNGPPKTRNRIRPHQLARLERLYAEDTHPPTPAREALGKEIGLELKTVTIWFQNKRQTVKKEQAAALAAAESMQCGGTPEGSSDSDYFESPHSAHSSTAHGPVSGSFHHVVSMQTSPSHGRHMVHPSHGGYYTDAHSYSRPYHHPYQRPHASFSRSAYASQPDGSSLPPTVAHPVGHSFTLDQACAYQSSRQAFSSAEEDELDDDIEILDGPPELSPTRVAGFKDKNYTWKMEGEGGDTDTVMGAESADEVEVITPSVSMHSIPRILNNDSPQQARNYSEEMVDAAIVLCGLGRV